MRPPFLACFSAWSTVGFHQERALEGRAALGLPGCCCRGKYACPGFPANIKETACSMGSVGSRELKSPHVAVRKGGGRSADMVSMEPSPLATTRGHLVHSSHQARPVPAAEGDRKHKSGSHATGDLEVRAMSPLS